MPVALGGVLELLRAIPEEQLWLEGQRSPATRRAYASDVVAFMRFFGITTTEEPCVHAGGRPRRGIRPHGSAQTQSDSLTGMDLALAGALGH